MISAKRSLSLMVGLIFSGIFMTTLSPADGASSTRSKRLVTVRDAITATKLGLPDSILSGDVSDLAAIFSPDRQRFLVVLKRGNLENNTNDFSVLLYETADVLKAPAPRTLFTMSSSSNHEAIRDIKWQDGSQTFHFMGENHSEPTALYRFTIADNHLERVTQHATPVVAYDVSMDGGQFSLRRIPPSKRLFTPVRPIEWNRHKHRESPRNSAAGLQRGVPALDDRRGGVIPNPKPRRREENPHARCVI